jgi:hypothetical protein
VRLDSALPAKSYFPSWMRSRALSNDAELGDRSTLPTPNLANTIHGSLHGGNAFADGHWASASSQHLPSQAILTPPSGLLVLGARSPLASPPVKVCAHDIETCWNVPVKTRKHCAVGLGAISKSYCT